MNATAPATVATEVDQEIHDDSTIELQDNLNEEPAANLDQEPGVDTVNKVDKKLEENALAKLEGGLNEEAAAELGEEPGVYADDELVEETWEDMTAELEQESQLRVGISGYKLGGVNAVVKNDINVWRLLSTSLLCLNAQSLRSVLKLAGNRAYNSKRSRIQSEDISRAICDDDQLDELCRNADFASGGVLPCIRRSHLIKKTTKGGAKKSTKAGK